jgi:radical SAM protein with 4Fe4S-binding SPASM domain
MDAGADARGPRAAGRPPWRSHADAFDHTPIVAIWEVTRACDLRCVHCRADAIPRRDPRELSTTDGLELIDQLAELAPGVVVLTGGDPLKRPDLFLLITAAIRRNLRVAIAPSVTPLLTRDTIARFAAAGVCRIALSLDGPDATTHDALRGTPGSFHATRAAIDNARAIGLPLQINTSLTRRTAWELPATGARVASLAPTLWSVFFVVPTGRAGRDDQLDPDAAEGVFHYLYDWEERTGLPVKTTAAPAYRRVVLARDARRPRQQRDRQRMLLAVNDGRGFVFVSHTGDVYPSGFLPLVCGNVRRTRLATIYRQSPLLRVLRDENLLGGKCGVCPFRTVCGGSRARAYATTGYFLAADPACAYVPRGYSPHPRS